jgi:hypothetical protein
MRRTGLPLLGLLVLLGVSTSSRAADEAIEINQASALAGGVTPGDAPGFPVSLTKPGTYVVTSELNVLDPNADAIVAHRGASIDLNGFGISRASEVGGNFAGRGIVGADVVENGRVHGFREGVVRAQTVRRVTVSASYLRGIDAREVVESGADGGIYGIWAHTVRHSIASRCLSTGIRVGHRGSVVESVSAGNGTGVVSGVESTVDGNVVTASRGLGIVAGVRSTVSSNSVTDSGGDGIRAGNFASVRGNAVRGSAGRGLVLAPHATFVWNTITANAGGSTAGGIDMGQNACNGTTVCP